jgi:Tol biopolymer transport system component
VTDTIDRLQPALGDRYRIERELGAGGMATVYLAEDVKHDRKVALKVLRPELAAVIGAERFLKEIKLTANLQHPHILGLIDSGEADGLLWYVMPFMEGESLRDRLTREHQLPVADAVRITTEVASALDYAHRHGVVHRDIKPENILLHDGQALVADFGIALAVSSAGGTRMTETGMSLGTPHYMSPEQAMGEREITARSDVYALGCVTYEMLVGEPPFTGPTAQAIVARVMTEEPRGLTIQRRTVPPHVEAAVHTALAKLPADRFPSAAEFAAALANPAFAGTAVGVAAARPAGPPARRLAVVVGAIALAAGIGLGLLIRRPPRQSRDVTRMMMALADSGTVRPIANIRLAISPNGRRIAYIGPDGAGGNGLWVREMNEIEGKLLPGTTGAEAPFFSPDGESIAFFVTNGGASGDIEVTPASGGMVRTVLADSARQFGGSWGDDDALYFDAKGGIARVPASGGTMTYLSQPDTTGSGGATEHDYPDVLPGAKAALVQLWKGAIGQNDIGAVAFATGKITTLVRGSYARFLPPDRLVFGTADGRIFVAPFDPSKLTLTGEPVLALQNVQTEANNGTVQFAVSASGTLVYLSGQPDQQQLVWVDRRSGKATPVDTTWLGTFTQLALSPDGSRLAVAIAGQEESSIWVKRLPTGPLTRLTLRGSGPSDRPVWLPDGSSVAYLATRSGRRVPWMQRADGSGEARAVVQGSTQWDEVTFSPDGRSTVLRTLGSAAGTRKLFLARLAADSPPQQLLAATYDNFAPTFSPDGHWLAYVSSESGQNEVYVRPFPAVDAARWTVSVGGGTEPVWAHSGRELFYRTERGAMMVVPISTSPTFHSGTPVILFSTTQMYADVFHRSYDVTPDDQRFLMIRGTGTESKTIGVVLHWGAELDRRR